MTVDESESKNLYILKKIIFFIVTSTTCQAIETVFSLLTPIRFQNKTVFSEQCSPVRCSTGSPSFVVCSEDDARLA